MNQESWEAEDAQTIAFEEDGDQGNSELVIQPNH